LGYPLSGQDLYKGSTFTISNQAVSSEIEVSIAEGVLLLVLEQ
jgi:thiamine pyrophosphokinase